ncbi:putative pentatricopeptide repeat-containing protein At1g68930 [Diospyros lotus]|uniref:putative pentatricopeptide repeat-containing protein At1g68930 n=1 Tax=Diospyros lotus TaxID=55363 RepID=UPI002250D6C7|nr:putative pentatricopeptide repeat-containing protein At1g68930 [Diospyros lotus]XP_052199201.1 putative pentatricopeptide repeat-containing protein At1g68930 [Diospyros lotus]XP_052199202.1 putative pentatricopeptide repeat-containing protein At1g68930 [Diospyros lotus]XP_052199203.1 putative pentatricopeptide repeat-containing protein At1g68930 [Diospyros lotus]XP_052199204.1 putative pentatricopeptide repeat-containing protein At1g68930 [Diospyros lotus]XP_052199205.1 putative pentatricop
MKARQKLREAVDLLYSRGCATAEAYTRLLLECVRYNDVDQAKRLHSHMDLHLYQPPNTFLHNRLVQFYARSGLLSDARNLFEKMPNRDVYSYNSMLSAYSKLGLVDDMWAFFHRMPRRDSVSYNTVIAGLAANGWLRRALEVFVGMQKEGFEPTEYTNVSVLNVCSRALDLKRGKQIHGKIEVSNLEGNVYTWNALIDMYNKCGEIHLARWLFDRMVDKNAVSWNLIISGYLKNGQPEKCIDLFREMQLSGLKPDEVTVSSVLGAFFQGGYIYEARKIFSELEEKDEVCWTTMIVGYAQSGQEEEALLLFRQMLLENVKPDSFTISTIVSSCARLASLYHGQVVHGKAVHMGVDCNLLVSSALINMYSKSGEIKNAWAVFSLMPIRNVVSWNSIILGYAQNGKDLEALALYEEMILENFKPDDITFTGVLSACVHAGLLKRGQDYFRSIREFHGMTPTLDHYACMINLFGRSGYIDKAIDLINVMPHEPNGLVWSTLLSVCAMKGDIVHGEMAAKQLFELDPLNAGPYIMLSNIYAACGRWKDVASTRSLMKSKMVKKHAAYSWIEIDGEVFKFVAEDRTHPELGKIYEELNKLIKKLEDAGFIPQTNLVLHDIQEDEKFKSICYHSEKLALAFGLLRKPQGMAPIRIIKNIRVCADCHEFMKLVSKINGRSIILRDSNRFHHFVGGQCSCNGIW